MSKQYLVSTETVKTVVQGALGALTFGAYHQFISNKMMELNNEKMDLQHKYDMNVLREQHDKQMRELTEQVKILSDKNNKRWW